MAYTLLDEVEFFLEAYREGLAEYDGETWANRKALAHSKARTVSPRGEEARTAYMVAVAGGRSGESLGETERAGQGAQTGMRAACREAAKRFEARPATPKPAKRLRPTKPAPREPLEPENKLTVKAKYARLALELDVLPPDLALAVFGNVTPDAVRHARHALSSSGFAFARGEAGSWRVMVRPSKPGVNERETTRARARLEAELSQARANLDSLAARLSELS